MKKRRNTKKALLGSLTMMLLCFALLLGTTFAWFTDTVSSSETTIQSGNLKVGLEYAVQPENEGNLVWKSATEGSINLFGTGENFLLEPGATGMVYLRVTNQGSLSAKYQYNIEVASNIIGKTGEGADIDLTNHIRLGVKEFVNGAYPATKDGREAAQAVAQQTIAAGITENQNSESGKLIAYQSASHDNLQPKGSANDADKSGIIAVVVYMPEDVGNAANHNGTAAPSISLKVNLKATQDSAESDVFGKDYDEDAAYPASATQPQSGEGQTG